MTESFSQKSISVLGSTGSIGSQTLSVCEQHPEIRVAALAAFDEVTDIARQAHRFRPELVALADKSRYAELKSALADIPCRIEMGEEGVCEVASLPAADTVVAAISGIAGLTPTWAAIEAGKTIALANKEVLVTAGEIVMKEASLRGVRILPVDSEHSAIFQCLHGAHEEVESLIITASGGAFFGYSAEQLENVTSAEALCHPTWNMGPKITVDSASLMNKGFEIIEAHHLFNMPYERIIPVIHRESIVHSLVQYRDGAVLALLSEPDMRLPIQYALSFPQRFPSPIAKMDWQLDRSLSFFRLDIADYPCLEMALEAGRRGGEAPIALNAANEVLVQAFLRGEIGFLDIPRNLEKILMKYRGIGQNSLAYVLETDRQVRAATQALLPRR